MTMDRRTFSLAGAGAAGALALAGLPRSALAQRTAPIEGRDFFTLAKPIAVPGDGKIEVVEFFWFGCPHCYAFEPVLEPWIAKRPADVNFRRVPVGFTAIQETHQRVYYTWEALGMVEAMHMNTFMRFQIQRKPIDSLDDMVAFAQQSNVDAAKVRATWNSFGVQTRCQQAKRLVDDYGVDRTPEMGIQGRFTAVGGPASMLAATDWLVDRVRHGG
jgi:thiol:disulfide interchange protein DsbA